MKCVLVTSLEYIEIVELETFEKHLYKIHSGHLQILVFANYTLQRGSLLLFWKTGTHLCSCAFLESSGGGALYEERERMRMRRRRTDPSLEFNFQVFFILNSISDFVSPRGCRTPAARLGLARHLPVRGCTPNWSTKTKRTEGERTASATNQSSETEVRGQHELCLCPSSLLSRRCSDFHDAGPKSTLWVHRRPWCQGRSRTSGGPESGGSRSVKR